MLWTIAIIFALLWMLGLVSHYTLGGLIHLFLVVAVVLLAVRVLWGRGRRRPNHAR